MDGGAPLFDDSLNLVVEFLHGPIEGHGKEGQDFPQVHGIHHVQIPRIWGCEFQGADQFLLVAQGRDKEAPCALLHDLVLNG